MPKINLVLTVMGVAGFTGIKAQQANTEINKRVNIIMFIADDLGTNDIGPYGNKIIRTPNIDKLAGQSMLFTRAFASSSTSAPSRASLHTGLMPFRNGAHANHTGINDGILTMPARMQSLGYRVALAGKLHLGPMPLYPFELIHNTNVPEPGHEKQGDLWTDLNLAPVDEWLSKASADDKPFVLVVNDHSPHVIWPEKAAYDPAKIDVPSIHIDTENTRKMRARYYTDITKMDGNLGKLLASLEKYKLSGNTIVIFTADQGPQWAFGKWNLYDYGIRVPLLIKWPGTIKAGTKTDAMVSLVDILPTAIEIAGGTVPKEYQEIDGRSLLPFLTGKKKTHRDTIFASYTGDGTMNLTPMRMIRTSRYKYILNLAPEVRYTTHIDKARDNNAFWQSWVNSSFRTEHAASVLWRYHNRPKEELYDLENDPDEQKNLAFDPGQIQTLEMFRQQMTQWRNQQGDHETTTFIVPKNTSGTPVAPYIFQ